MFSTLFYQGFKLKLYQVYEDYDEFEQCYLNSPFNSSLYKTLSSDIIELTYNLLVSKYYNFDILNNKDWFVLNVTRIMSEYAPQFEKQLQLQKELLDLTNEEIEKGTRQIFNKALNPDTSPSSSEIEEISFISEQTSSNIKKSKLDARIDYLDTISRINYTEIYLDRFKHLFSKFVGTISPVLYATEEDE